MLDLRICNRKYTENRTSCKRFQISKLVEIQRFHKISGSLYEISSELWTPRFVTEYSFIVKISQLRQNGRHFAIIFKQQKSILACS